MKYCIAVVPLFFVALSLVVWNGCLACTLVDCSDEVVVEIRGLQAGERYDITLVTEDSVSRCTALMPEDTSGDFYDDRAIDCNVETPEAFVRGADATIVVSGTPESIEIAIHQDEDVRAQLIALPDYEKQAPNGERCGPVCHRAGVAVEL